MKHVKVLQAYIDKQTTVGLARRWIREWLFPNKLNENRLIPINAPFTLVSGLKILFELPYEAVCEVVQDNTGIPVVPYIAVSDSEDSDILIVATDTAKVLMAFKHKAWEFRFRNLQALETWLETTAKSITASLKGRTNGKRG